jgi:hypothetical protein
VVGAHDFRKARIERVDLERLLRYLERAPIDIEGMEAPDWTYTFGGERWWVEITFASPIARDLGRAYRNRLEREPWSRSTPSTSSANLDGLSAEMDTLVDEMALKRAIQLAIGIKGKKRYGNEIRTHLLIDASGQRVEGWATAQRIAAACPVASDYPYAGVFVVFAIEEWQRTLIPLARQSLQIGPPPNNRTGD